MIEIVFNKVHKLETFRVAEFSRMIPNRRRPRILRQFRANKIQVYVNHVYCFCLSQCENKMMFNTKICSEYLLLRSVPFLWAL